MRRGSITRLTRPLVLAAVIPALIGFTPPQTAVASSGPAIVKNINLSGDSDPSSLTKVGTTLFFAANDGIHGRELWKSDGSAAGTKMVKDVRAGSRGSFPGDLINVSGTLFFTANDGSHGRELWRSNGTAAGTVMVKDLTNDELSGTNTSLYLPVAVGSRLFFFVAECCAGGSSLVVRTEPRRARTASKSRSRMSAARAHWARSCSSFRRITASIRRARRSGSATAPRPGLIDLLPRRRQMKSRSCPPPATSCTSRQRVSGVGIRLWRTDGTASGTIALTTADSSPTYQPPRSI